MIRVSHRFRIAFSICLILGIPKLASAANDVAGSMTVFNDNGAWSWFEDERVIVDTSAGAAGKIIVSSVADSSGTSGASRDGNIDVAALDLQAGAVDRFVLRAGLEDDDHDSAALWRRPDGRYLAMYSRHGGDNFTRYRISTNPGDISSWDSELSFNNNAGTTYSNLHYLPNDNGGAGRLYNFTRTVNFNPNVLVSYDTDPSASTNIGSSWSYGGKLLTIGTGGTRPYVKYWSDSNRIHLITTDGHPRDVENSIYYGYVQDGVLYRSNGSVADANILDSSGFQPNNLTTIFTTGSAFQLPGETTPTTMRDGWTIDIASDSAGLPYVVFQARANNSPADHRFFYGRYDGPSGTWNVHEIAKAGGFLYSAEGDYTGLAALDPSDPNRLFISSTIDPRTQVAMPHYEIFEGRTTNGGANWTWDPISFNSTGDNLRPIVPKWDDDHTALLWMRGTYSAYTDWNLDIVGVTNITPIESTGLADLNKDGHVNLADFGMFLNGFQSNLSGLSLDQAYAKGDLTGDYKSDFTDWVLFRNEYDLANGAGSFAAALTSIPEPTGLTLLAMGSIGIIGISRRARANRTRKLVVCGLPILVCFAMSSASNAVPLLAVDVNGRNGDSTAGPPGPNTVAGYSSFTLTGNFGDGVPNTTRTIGAYTVTLTSVNASGAAAGTLLDRDRDLPTTTPTLNQLYDDFVMANTDTGTGGGMNLAISGGSLIANTQYAVSIYSFDSGSTLSPQPRTARWLDGNSSDTVLFDTSFNGANLPTTDAQYKYTAVAQTDGLGKLMLKGRNTLTSNFGVFLNGFEVSIPNELTLEVNTTTGSARILNEQSGSFNMSYYEIRSNAGRLNPSTWIGLDDTEAGPDPLGSGWSKVPESDATLLNEINLTSSTTFAPNQSASFGDAFNVGGNTDLRFYYAGPGEQTFHTGIVRYVSGAESLAGDYNGNGGADAADYVQWRKGGPLQNEGRTTGITDEQDYNFWRLRFGETSGPQSGAQLNGAAVPEPTTLGLLVITAFVKLARNQWTRSLGRRSRIS